VFFFKQFSSLTAALDPEILQKLRNNFYDDPKNVLAQNVCTRIDPFDVCLSRKHIAETQHAFTHKVWNGFVIMQICLLLVGFDFTFHLIFLITFLSFLYYRLIQKASQ